MTDSSQTVSIIVVTHNSQPVLIPFLESLSIALSNITAQVIVIDNASQDGTLDVIKSRYPQAQLIENNENIGFARAVNQGAKLAQSEWLLLLNPDLELESDCIRNLIEQASSYKDIGLATGRIKFPDGSFQSVCRNLPTLGNLIFSRGFFLSRIFSKSQAYTLPDYDNNTPVPAVAGTMMLTRRSIWEQLGGFDERFFMFMEDTDLSKRAIEIGLINQYLPSATAIHKWGRGSSISHQRRRYYHHLSLWHYFRKHNNWLLVWTIVLVFLWMNFLLGSIVPCKRHS